MVGTVCTPNCDPLTNQGCLSSDACRIAQRTPGNTIFTYCGARGTGGQGQACTGNASCMVGFECVINTTGHCEQLCHPANSTCPSGYTCNALGSLGSTMIGACE